MKRVLLTGAGGFIGRHCLPFLKARGVDIHAVTRNKTNAASDGVRWHSCDLLAPKAMENLLKEVQPSHLLHAAWFVEHGAFWSAKENESWADLSERMVKEFFQNGGERFVGLGTCAEYKWSTSPLKENASPLEPSSVYGTCKKRVFNACETLPASASWAWARIFYLFGPYENPKRLIPSVINSVLKGEPVFCSSGEQLRNFLYVEDQADALVTLLASDQRGAFNVASHQPSAIKDVLKMIGNKLNHPDLVRIGERPSDPNDPPVILADTGRLEKELRWHSALNLEEGLDKTIAWWRTKQ